MDTAFTADHLDTATVTRPTHWLDYVPLLPQVETHALAHGGLWMFRPVGSVVGYFVRLEPTTVAGRTRVRVLGQHDGDEPFDLAVVDGRLVCDDGIPLHWMRGGWEFVPVDKRTQPVPLSMTARAWRQDPYVPTLRRHQAERGLIAEVRGVTMGPGPNEDWAACTPSKLVGVFPSAMDAMRALDERLLRLGYVLEGTVYASPLVPGYRAHPQGYARSR